MTWVKTETTENELIANKKAGRIYCGNFAGGKYISVESYRSHTPIDSNNIAILDVSPRVELRISYIESRDGISGFRLKKIKYNSTTKRWESDGEIVLSKFTLRDLAGLSELLSKISLRNITQSKIDIDQIDLRDEENLEKTLRSIVSTPVGRKFMSIISKTQSISESDIVNVAFRKEQLEIFKALLDNTNYFNSKKSDWSCQRDEDVWQKFFETNPWILGYGLSLISCEAVDDEKLEQIVAGATIFQPGGKRIDALLKTRGFIKSLVFTEIKTHKTLLLEGPPYRRPDTFQVSKEVSGGCSQVQKTIHKAMMRLSENSLKIVGADGTPTGEEVAVTQPKGILIVGSLKQFESGDGINFEKFSSFELFRRNTQNPDVITFDELYERAKYTVESDDEVTI